LPDQAEPRENRPCRFPDSSFTQSTYSWVNIYVYTTTTQVQVRIPKELVKEIDSWISEGRFSSRSEAIKTIVTLYNERERTRKFYQMLVKRGEEATKSPETLVPLDDIS
jgi:Arc/MetJ-type ribon-helix-helix transcriptional regulator